MKLSEIARKVLRLKKPEADSKTSSDEKQSVKNGPLTLAVGASIILLAVLTFTNLRLIRDPSIAGKVFRFSASAPVAPACPVAREPFSGSAEKKPPSAPPEVTFYNTLTALAEHKPGEVTAAGPNPDTDSASDAPKTPPLPHTAKKQDNQAVPQTAAQPGLASAPKPTKPLKPEKGTRTYTVQVGAFSHPGIAQQWAHKWKARGFDVTLKPVARPRSGVIYRLYLGNFPSEKKADELVERLKTKEGISAFRLVVQN